MLKQADDGSILITYVISFKLKDRVGIEIGIPRGGIDLYIPVGDELMYAVPLQPYRKEILEALCG